jgi:hypothetical protein
LKGKLCYQLKVYKHNKGTPRPYSILTKVIIPR